MAVDNRVPWGIFRERKDPEYCLEFTTDGSQRARLPIPLRHRCHPSCAAKDLA